MQAPGINMAHGEQKVKIVMVGDQSVGKSSLVQQFAFSTFDSDIESTQRISSTEKTVDIEGKRITLGIWDTAGQEKYRSLGPIYYRGCCAALVVYDITRRNTFETLQYWVKELREHGGRSLAIGICGNKCDLVNERKVSFEEGEALAAELGALFAETSAKLNEDHNIDSFFIRTTKQGLENKGEFLPQIQSPVTNPGPQQTCACAIL